MKSCCKADDGTWGVRGIIERGLRDREEARDLAFVASRDLGLRIPLDLGQARKRLMHERQYGCLSKRAYRG